MWFSDAAGLGAQLRAQRRKLHLTQHQLAALAGISRRTIISIEQGGPSELSKVFAILRALDLQMQVGPTRQGGFGLGSLEQETEPL